ncbi:MAG TPA: M56 family metallopeptidase [Sphingomicrobium sp.]|nr:M56 family metallopeptidase [Sphingomicrobium sp.]
MTDWLLGTLLATSGLIVLVLLIREPVRRHFGSRVAYGLWLIPAMRLLMPTLSETVERPMTMTVTPRLMSTQITAEPLLLASVRPPAPSLIDQMGGWPTMLLTAWLGVAAGLFLARILAFRRERGIILADADDLGWIGSIRIIQSAHVTGPVAFGIFERVIAVPADFEFVYAPHERRLALDHELAHHRAGDLLVNLFAFVLLCLQWFNPLAWIAHAAFRFDQEAACDARVLDKAKAQDRADYGRAIAKAASGRALLFASALDRRKTLHRRLKSMLTNPSSGRRITGRLMVLATVAIALPLTATRAVNYIDVPTNPAPLAPAAPVAAPAPSAPLAPVAAVAPVATVAPVHAATAIRFDDAGTIHINGNTKRWKDLTPAEKAEVRRSIAHAKEEIARTRIDREQIRREVREAMSHASVNKEELRRDLAEARAEIERAMREIDGHVVDIRRSGRDPNEIKATIRASLKAVEAIDVDAITRQALASVDHEAIEASVAAAEASVARAQDEIDRIEEQFEDDEE